MTINGFVHVKFREKNVSYTVSKTNSSLQSVIDTAE